MACVNRLIAAIACASTVACTPGGAAMSVPNGAGGGMGAPAIVNANLTLNAAASTTAGLAGGYAPLTTTIAVGSTLQFVNTDSFAHTATSIPGATTFPGGSPFGSSAQSAAGSMLSQTWSSGTLQAGARSQAITVDKPGTYLFGCFFHYGAPMRGQIVAM